MPPRSAYTPQVPHLFSDTLQENILLGLPEHSVNLQDAIRTTVLERDITGLEHGLQTIIGTKGVKLSGGQVQRTAGTERRTPGLRRSLKCARRGDRAATMGTPLCH